MEYQNTWADNRMIRKMENEERNMLSKFYNLKKTDTNCPKKAYLLEPKKLFLTSYEILPNNIVKLNVGYSKNYSGYISDRFRMNYRQYIFGTLYCEQVESINEDNYNNEGIITKPLFSNIKTLNLPVQEKFNVVIRCKNIVVKDIDIYAKNKDDKFILNDDYVKQVVAQLEANNR
jgi:hypothetical protein